MLKRFLIFAFLIISLSHGKAQIVNVEGTRLDETKKGWQGLIDFNFYSVKTTSSILKLNNTVRAQYSKKKHTFLFLNNLNFILSSGKDYEQNYFQHFRYNYFVDSNLTLEIFTQNQFDRLMYIERRFLAGVGPRYQFVHGKKMKLNFGMLYMYEFEKELDSPIKRHDHRLSTYLAFQLKFKESFIFRNTTYYQPLFVLWEDFRLSSNSSLQLKLNSNLSVLITLGLAYDSFPVANRNIPNLTYRLTNGLSISL